MELFIPYRRFFAYLKGGIMRRTFAEVLRSGGFDLHREYANLYDLVYDKRLGDPEYGKYSLWDVAAEHFSGLGFVDTSVSLRDFDERHHFVFHPQPNDLSLNDFVSLAEYAHNIFSRAVGAVEEDKKYNFEIGLLYTAKCYQRELRIVLTHIERLVDAIGYQSVQDGDYIIFVERDSLANQVAEVLPESVAYRALSYRHYSYEGDLPAKAAILNALGHELEPLRQELAGINAERTNDIFFGLNNLDIRHSNASVHERLDDAQLERLYDELYQLMLIAFAELDVANGGNLIRTARRAAAR